MVSTPKKLFDSVTKRLKRRPTAILSTDRGKQRNLSNGSRYRESTRRLSDNLVHEMHVKMKAAALFMDPKSDPGAFSITLTCTDVMLNEGTPSDVELSLEVGDKVLNVPVGEQVTVESVSRSTCLNVLVRQKDGTSQTARDGFAEKAFQSAKMMKKKFASLRASRMEGAGTSDDKILGSAQVIVGNVLRKSTNADASEITIMKGRLGKRSIIPLGLVSIKATVTAPAGHSNDAELDRDSPLAKDIGKMMTEMDKENMNAKPNTGDTPATKGTANNGLKDPLSIVHEGFLSVERTADKTGWKMYWARLLSSGEMLCYLDEFQVKEPGTEEMVFDLSGASRVSRPPMHEMPSRNGIKVSFSDGGDPFYMLAETMPECRCWIQAFEATVGTADLAMAA